MIADDINNVAVFGEDYSVPVLPETIKLVEMKDNMIDNAIKSNILKKLEYL